jgi:hypothetical protein
MKNNDDIAAELYAAAKQFEPTNKSFVELMSTAGQFAMAGAIERAALRVPTALGAAALCVEIWAEVARTISHVADKIDARDAAVAAAATSRIGRA